MFQLLVARSELCEVPVRMLECLWHRQALRCDLPLLSDAHRCPKQVSQQSGSRPVCQKKVDAVVDIPANMKLMLLPISSRHRRRRRVRSNETEVNLPRGIETCRGDGPQPRHCLASGAMGVHP